MADDITESKEFQTVSTKLFALGVRDPEELYQMTLDVMGTPQDDSSRFGDPLPYAGSLKSAQEAAKEFMSIKSDIEEQQRKLKALESEQRLSWFPEEQAAAEQLKERGKDRIFDLLEPFDYPRRGVEKAVEKVGPALLEAADYPRRELSKESGKLMKRAGVSPHSSSTGKVPRTVTEELSEQELQLKKILEGETATEKE